MTTDGRSVNLVRNKQGRGGNMLKEKSGYLLLIVGMLLAGLGVFRQEAVSVLQKAIVICLQCIGIG